jgi:acyl-CoA reductase-like NAD-dependent aldehyde dehydrogenase
MRLYVGPMDAVVVEVGPDGRVRLDNEDWSTPSLQERRAILYAASNEIEELRELIERLDDQNSGRQV